MGRRDRELRDFIRENTLRVEHAMRSLDRSIHAFAIEIRDEVRVARDELRAHDRRESRKIDELIEENRAQRQALLRILDRLDDGGAAPAA